PDIDSGFVASRIDRRNVPSERSSMARAAPLRMARLSAAPAPDSGSISTISVGPEPSTSGGNSPPASPASRISSPPVSDDWQASRKAHRLSAAARARKARSYDVLMLSLRVLGN